MSAFNRGRFLAVALLSPLVVFVSACGGSSSGGEQPAAAGSDCTGKLAPADPAAALPSGFPSPPGAVFYQVSTVGATNVHFGYVTGDNVVTARDAIQSQLTGAGFKINGHDQEPNVEAELDADSSAHGGTVQVIHLCKGYLRVRFSLDH